MKHFLRRYSFLVIAQTACLALGFWLESRFAASLAKTGSPDGVAVSAVEGAPASDAPGPDSAAPNTPPEAAAPQVPYCAIRITSWLWIAAVQAVVAYLVLTREQEESARRHQQAEHVSLQQYNELLRTRDAVIFGLAKLAESRDPDAGNHLERIAIYSTRLASVARHEPCYRDRITPSFIKLIGISSALHDIGKVGVRDSILLKPGRLERSERLMVQLHVAIGGRCIREIESRLGRSNFLSMAREIAFGHHEHWDGSGYPNGLTGEEIPLAARIVAIADVYDALYTKRVYKEAYPHNKCVEMIREGAGKQFDPTLVNIFLKLESEFHEIADSCRETPEGPGVETDSTAGNCPPSSSAESQPVDTADSSASSARFHSLDDTIAEIRALIDECANEVETAKLDDFSLKHEPSAVHGAVGGDNDLPQVHRESENDP
jgi:HD-GYP domain-containing protein (c-di-GMP phosphodiesterase class II)